MPSNPIQLSGYPDNQFMSSKLLPSWAITFFFFIGLFSATLFRLIIFLNRINIVWARVAWYAGVFGYICFFGFRFYIAAKRRKVIANNNLLDKVRNSDIEVSAKAEIEYLLNSLTKSREIVNYIYIFATSIIAIALDILLTVLAH
jgi:hypothetical protein